MMKRLALLAAILALSASTAQDNQWQYTTQTSGLCATPILNVSECQQAFDTLGLAASVNVSLPSLPDSIDLPKVPDLPNGVRDQLPGFINDVLPEQDQLPTLPSSVDLPDLSAPDSVDESSVATTQVSRANMPQGCLSLGSGVSSVVNTNTGEGLGSIIDLPNSLDLPQIPQPTLPQVPTSVPTLAGLDLNDLVDDLNDGDVNDLAPDSVSIPSLPRPKCSAEIECVCKVQTCPSGAVCVTLPSQSTPTGAPTIDPSVTRASDRRVKFRATIQLPSQPEKQKIIGDRLARDLQAEFRKLFPKLVVIFVDWTFVGLKPVVPQRHLLSGGAAEYDARFDFKSASTDSSDATAQNAGAHFKDKLANDAPAMSDMMAASVSSVDAAAGNSMKVEAQQASVVQVPVGGGDESNANSDDDSSGLSMGLIAGIIGGAVFVLVIVAVLIIMRKKNQTVRNNKNHSQAIAVGGARARHPHPPVTVQVEKVKVVDQKQSVSQ